MQQEPKQLPPKPGEAGPGPGSPSDPPRTGSSGVGAASVIKALREWEQRKAADHAKRTKDRPS